MRMRIVILQDFIKIYIHLLMMCLANFSHHSQNYKDCNYAFPTRLCFPKGQSQSFPHHGPRTPRTRCLPFKSPHQMGSYCYSYLCCNYIFLPEGKSWKVLNKNSAGPVTPFKHSSSPTWWHLLLLSMTAFLPVWTTSLVRWGTVSDVFPHLSQEMLN